MLADIDIVVKDGDQDIPLTLIPESVFEDVRFRLVTLGHSDEEKPIERWHIHPYAICLYDAKGVPMGKRCNDPVLHGTVVRVKAIRTEAEIVDLMSSWSQHVKDQLQFVHDYPEGQSVPVINKTLADAVFQMVEGASEWKAIPLPVDGIDETDLEPTIRMPRSVPKPRRLVRVMVGPEPEPRTAQTSGKPGEALLHAYRQHASLVDLKIGLNGVIVCTRVKA